MFYSIMEKLNISGDRALIYKYLLENAQDRPGIISKQLGIPRASIYCHLNHLVSSGLVFITLKDGAKLYITESPERLIAI